MAYAKIDSKGRMTIPQQYRERLGLTAGRGVYVRERGGTLTVSPEPEDLGPVALGARAMLEAGDVVPFKEFAARFGIHYRAPARRRAPWLKRRKRHTR